MLDFKRFIIESFVTGGFELNFGAGGMNPGGFIIIAVVDGGAGIIVVGKRGAGGGAGIKAVGNGGAGIITDVTGIAGI